ncbi:MAG: hypothetical protein NTW96_26475 [Planctomycetia bacterium]|nr:hypothetical protein [Planctomycetia bacterium]
MAARLGQVSLIFATLVALAAAGARAEEKDSEKYPVKQASYSTGAQGAKLTWLPYRPAAESLRGRVVKSDVARAQFETSAEPKATGGADPKKDPFGDGVTPGKSPTAPPALKPQGGLLDRLDAQLLPPDSSPKAGETVEKPSPETPSDGSPAKTESKSLPPLSAKEGKKPTGETAGQDGGPQLTPAPNGNGQRIPTLEEELATNVKRGDEGCPPTAEFKPIGEINNQIAAEQGKFPPECPLNAKPFEPRAWAPTTFAWNASGLCHKPLYFEDLPISARAGLLEAGVWVGGVFLVP